MGLGKYRVKKVNLLGACLERRNGQENRNYHMCSGDVEAT